MTERPGRHAYSPLPPGSTADAASGPQLVAPPTAGQAVEVEVEAGQVVALPDDIFSPDSARYLAEGPNLVVLLEAGGRLVLKDFFGHPDLPPSLSVLGGPAVPADDLLRAVEGRAEPVGSDLLADWLPGAAVAPGAPAPDADSPAPWDADLAVLPEDWQSYGDEAGAEGLCWLGEAEAEAFEPPAATPRKDT